MTYVNEPFTGVGLRIMRATNAAMDWPSKLVLRRLHRVGERAAWREADHDAGRCSFSMAAFPSTPTHLISSRWPFCAMRASARDCATDALTSHVSKLASARHRG